MSQFQKVSIPDLMDTFEAQTVKGEWFENQKSKLYKDVYPVISAMDKSYFSRPLEKDANGKYLVALLPDKRHMKVGKINH